MKKRKPKENIGNGRRVMAGTGIGIEKGLFWLKDKDKRTFFEILPAF